MTLKQALVSANNRALDRGHSLRTWEDGDKSTGPYWATSCRRCGAMAMAEYTESGEVVTSGSAQRTSCAQIQRKKVRARALRRESRA